VYEVRKFLRPKDPRRVMVEARWTALQKKPTGPVTADDRTMLGVALRGVHYRNAVGFIRVRSLRNLQLGFAAVFVVLALGFALLGWRSPGAISVCLPKNVPVAATPTPALDGEIGEEGEVVEPAAQAPSPTPSPAPSPPVISSPAPVTPMVCPTGAATPAKGDVALVELLGLAGAAVAAARAVTGSSRPTGPYSTVVGQAMLKTVLGAMTALLGVWFLAAGFVPGVDDVDKAAEIIVYAVVFGYAQQLLTQLIDRRTGAAGDAVVPGQVEDAEPAPPDPAVA
jgi:hypothetical protein